MSDSFFLKLAFVPSDGFFQAKFDSLENTLNSKFTLYTQLKDTLQAFQNGLQGSVADWQGLGGELSVYGVGDLGYVNFIDPTAINYYKEKIKFWLGGFVYLMTIIYCIRKISAIIAGRGGS